jgi:hypothetical protein
MTDIVGKLVIHPPLGVTIKTEDGSTWNLADLVRPYWGKQVRVRRHHAVRSWLVIEVPPDPMRPTE